MKNILADSSYFTYYIITRDIFSLIVLTNILITFHSLNLTNSICQSSIKSIHPVQDNIFHSCQIFLKHLYFSKLHSVLRKSVPLCKRALTRCQKLSNPACIIEYIVRHDKNIKLKNKICSIRIIDLDIYSIQTKVNFYLRNLKFDSTKFF